MIFKKNLTKEKNLEEQKMYTNVRDPIAWLQSPHALPALPFSFSLLRYGLQFWCRICYATN